MLDAKTLDIVNKFMSDNYPNQMFTARPGNGCVWVTKGMVDMYLFIANGQVKDVQVD